MILGKRDRSSRSAKPAAVVASVLALVTQGCPAPAAGPDMLTPAAGTSMAVTSAGRAEGEPGAANPAQQLPPSAIFVEDTLAAFPKRGRIARYGSLRWRPDGLSFGGASREAPFADELTVLEENDTHAGVMFGDTRMAWWRVAAYVEKVDLIRTVVRAVRLEQDGGVAASDAHVELRPGALFEVVASEMDRSKLRVGKGDCLAIEGWVPSDALGVTYVDDAFDDDVKFQHTHELIPGTSLTSGPKGVTVATPRPCELATMVRPDGKPANGYQHVRARSGRIEIAGWVRSSSLKKIPEREYGMIGLLDPGHASPDSLPKGAALHASSTGEQVGVVQLQHRVKRGRSEAGRSEVTFEVDGYGPVTLWANDEAFAKRVPRVTSR